MGCCNMSISTTYTAAVLDSDNYASCGHVSDDSSLAEKVSEPSN